ncbi:MAG: hypothetical protein Kow0069_14410 [Promethearchaeota archaeon]
MTYDDRAEAVEELRRSFPKGLSERIDRVVDAWVETKRSGGKVCVVTGSGPNVHEGVTTLVAELIEKGLVDGVLTSSAVVAHEMAGALDRVKRVDGALVDFRGRDVALPKDGKFEVTLTDGEARAEISKVLEVDWDWVDGVAQLPGDVIVKAAGNMAYPGGLWVETIAERVLDLCIDRLAREYCFEEVVGLGADPHTMIGAASAKGVPVLVTVPQLVGGGSVGLCVGDSISIAERCRRVAATLAESSLIVESGLALAQEVHDGPFETHTGHGIWAHWRGRPTFSLEGKVLARFDLDPRLEEVWRMQREAGTVQAAIAEGKPKTKVTGVPFRMEMSGFARLESSVPVVGDLGATWPVVVHETCRRLGVELEFLSFPQETPLGRSARQFVVEVVRPLSWDGIVRGVEKLD